MEGCWGLGFFKAPFSVYGLGFRIFKFEGRGLRLEGLVCRVRDSRACLSTFLHLRFRVLGGLVCLGVIGCGV